MELSPATVALALAIVAYIGWQIRMESKTNAADQKTDKNERRIDRLEATVTEHKENTEVHHNAEDLDRRFETVTNGMSELKAGHREIKVELKSGFDNISKRIDGLFQQK